MTRRERWKNAAAALGIAWLILGGIFVVVGVPVLLASLIAPWTAFVALGITMSLCVLAAGYFDDRL